MKMPHELHGKNLLSLIILLLLVLSLPNALSLNTVEASAGEHPSIYIEPAITEETLPPGSNFTISIKTDYIGAEKADAWIGDDVTTTFYTSHRPIAENSEEVYVNEILMTRDVDYTIDYATGNITFTTAPGYVDVEAIYLHGDIWAWAFTLTYDPRVLHGGIRKTDTWTGDNVKTMFNTTGTPVVQDSEEVYVNQTLMTRIIRRTDVRSGDGLTRTFYTTQPVFPYPEFPDFLPYDETVLVDGYPKKKDVHYTIDYYTGNITFMDAPEVDAEIKVIYDIWGNYTIDYPTGTIEFPTPPGGLEIKATYLYGGVSNGDLITKEKHSSAVFHPGTFNNTIGKLSGAGAEFLVFPPKPIPTTSGPGTLANITFTVVGFGATNITLGPETVLLNPEPGAPPIVDRTQHGYLLNVQSIHDVAVFSLVAPDEAFLRELVSINVTVVNEGNHTESVTVTVYNDTTEIGTESFTLARGLFKMVSFGWNTTGIGSGTYTINATATIDSDEDPSDNTDTKQIELKTTHDVAIINILAPTTAAVGELVSVNVTIANQGNYNENVTLRVSYIQRQSLAGTDTDVVLNTATSNFTLNKGLSKTVSSKWDTTGLNTTGSYDGLKISYKISATVIVLKSIENPGGIDKDPGDNTDTEQIELKLGYDVEVDRISVDRSRVVVGEPIGIAVVVENVGVYNATNFYVEVTYDASPIGTQPVELLLPGDSKYLSFSWDTRDVDPASYKITAEAILATDEDLTNNKASKTGIFIKAPPIASFTFSPTEPIVNETVTFDASSSSDPDGTIDSYFWDFGDGTTELYVKDENLTATTTHAYTAAGTYTVNLTVTDNHGLTDTITTDVTVLLHDIAITSVTASPNTVKIGEPVSINVTVVNQGTEKETFNVTVYYDDIIIGTQSITELASGASQSLIFSWDTSDVGAGTYTIKALATTVTNETDTDDNTFTDGIVTVEEAPALGILLYVAAAGAAAIIIAAVAIYFLRIRKPKPT